MSELVKACRELRLTWLEQNIEKIIATHRWSGKMCAELSSALTDELNARNSGRLERRLKAAKIGSFKMFENFDWSWPKKIDKEKINVLFDLKFLLHAQNIIFYGPSGVGKTMIAKNLAYKAILAGHSALSVTASDLCSELKEAMRLGVYQSKLRKILAPSILIIDEIGYLSFDVEASDLLYEVISKRYEKNSTVVTTNIALQDWGKIFPQATSLVPLLDRLAHHCHLISIEADSYRNHESKNKKENKK